MDSFESLHEVLPDISLPASIQNQRLADRSSVEVAARASAGGKELPLFSTNRRRGQHARNRGNASDYGSRRDRQTQQNQREPHYMPEIASGAQQMTPKHQKSPPQALIASSAITVQALDQESMERKRVKATAGREHTQTTGAAKKARKQAASKANQDRSKANKSTSKQTTLDTQAQA